MEKELGVTREMLERAALEVDQAILDSLPNPADCHHEFSPEFERKMIEIMKLRKGD